MVIDSTSVFDAQNEVAAPADEDSPLEPRKFLGFSTPTGGAPTGKPTENKDDEVMMAIPATQPITKLEIDNSRRRLDFGECGDSDEVNVADPAGILIDHIDESNSYRSKTNSIDYLLEQALLDNDEEASQNEGPPVRASKGRSMSASPASSGLGTPSAVLGITRMNASSRPIFRDERIELKEKEASKPRSKCHKKISI